MTHSLQKVQALENSILLLEFENNIKKKLEISPLFSLGKFSELQDSQIFNSVKVSFDTIEWSNGLDLSPKYIWEESVLV